MQAFACKRKQPTTENLKLNVPPSPRHAMAGIGRRSPGAGGPQAEARVPTHFRLL